MDGRLVKPIDRSQPDRMVERLTVQWATIAQDLHRSGVDPDAIVHALLNTVLAVAVNTGLSPEGVEENLRTMADTFRASVDQAFADQRRRVN